MANLDKEQQINLEDIKLEDDEARKQSESSSRTDSDEYRNKDEDLDYDDEEDCSSANSYGSL